MIVLSDFNFDENTVNKLKDMMNKGELSDVISQIPPEMIQNFSSILNNSNSSNKSSSNSIHFKVSNKHKVYEMKLKLSTDTNFENLLDFCGQI